MRLGTSGGVGGSGWAGLTSNAQSAGGPAECIGEIFYTYCGHRDGSLYHDEGRSASRGAGRGGEGRV